METVAPPASGKYYADVAMVSTNHASVQTDLTWPNTKDTFMKVLDVEKDQHEAFKARVLDKQASAKDTKNKNDSGKLKNPSKTCHFEH